MLDRDAISAKLRRTARALELLGESRYRVSAYRRGADALDALHGDLGELIAQGRLTAIPGIGATLASQIVELHGTGTTKLLEGLESRLPKGALDEKARPRSSSKKRSRTQPREDRLRLVEATSLAEQIADYLRGSPRVRDVHAVGALRRGCEVMDAVELLAIAARPSDALARMKKATSLASVESESAGELRARLLDGTRVHLHAVTPDAKAAALQRLTGSDAHNAKLDAIARKRRLTIAVGGVKRGRSALAIDSEEALYERLGLEFVPPELRDGEGEVRAAAKGELPNLVTVDDVRGMVHCHSTYSDGRNSIEQMARAAEKMGMAYITITDHSPSAFYANGVKLDRLKKQWDEIARVQEKVGIRILRGTESDITHDGALDYPDKVLEKFDVIVASIHNRYHQDAKAMTARIIRALEHPLFKIWGHALGRLLLRRPPVDCDIDAILEVAAKSRVAIELNGDPYRMDMEPRLAKRAHALGIPFVLSVDAHAMRELENVSRAALMARRTGLTRDDILNTREVDDFVAAVRPLGSKRGSTRVKSVKRAARGAKG